MSNVDASCSICSQSYNSEAKLPLVLPCSHSFCHDCLQKLEAANVKLCPVCRKSWKDVKVSALLSCYQLIPAEDQAGQNRMLQSVKEKSLLNDCEEHDEDYIFWCTSCDIPACKKCWKFNHVGCDLVLIEEKYEALEKEYLKSISLLKDMKQSKISMHLSSNEKNVAAVRELIEKLQVLENELIQNKEDIQAWEKKAESILCGEAIPSIPSARKVLEISSEIKALCQELPATPSSLLLQMALAYIDSSDNASAFVTHMQCNTKELPNEETGDLKDGATWLISDEESATAVFKTLKNNYIRPSSLKITWAGIDEETFCSVFSKMKYSTEFVLDSFNCCEKPAGITHSVTSSLLGLFVKCSNLVKFWGHLDEAAVKKLPTTIRSVGLMLRDQEDMAAVNALSKVAFSGTQRLWPSWNELNLSVSKTFQPNFWKLSWAWSILVAVSRNSLGPSAVRIRVHLHLPQLRMCDLQWMGDLLRAMDLNKIGSAMLLYLPRTRIDPAALLGVLRDSGLGFDVHFPASLPQLVSREEVTELYMKYKQSVTWDLE